MKDPYWSLWGKLKSYERKTVEIDSVYDREFRVADEFAGELADELGTLKLLKRKLEVVLSAGQIFVAGCKSKTVNGDQHAVNYLRKIDTDDSYYRLMAIDIPSEGEFHSWIVGPVGLGNPGKRPIPQDMEVIDFSSRHYRRYVEEHLKVSEPAGIITVLDTETPRLSWRLPNPPDYLWTQFRNLPKWVRMSANKEATEELLANLGAFEPLMQLVLLIWNNCQ